MTTARRKAKARSSRSSSRKIACQGFRSFDATVLSTPTIALRPATPPVGAEREPHRDGEDHEEREPPAEDPRMREDAGRDDRDFLGHRQAEPGGEEDEEQPDVTQLLDEARDHPAPRASGRSASCALRTVYTSERRMWSSVRCEPSCLEWSPSHGSQTLHRRSFVLDLH